MSDFAPDRGLDDRLNRRQEKGGRSTGLSDRTEGRDLAGLAQHRVDFAGMQRFGADHLAGVFLDDDRTVFGASEQLAIAGEAMSVDDGWARG